MEWVDRNGNIFELLPFKGGYLLKEEFGKFDTIFLDRVFCNPKEIGWSASLFVNGKILACGGVDKCGLQGVGWAWVFLSNKASKYLKTIIKEIREFLFLVTKVERIHKLQATVNCKFDKGLIFASQLGFKKEGILEKLDKYEQDYYLVGRYDRI